MTEDRINVAIYSEVYAKVKKENELLPKEKRPSMVQHLSTVVEEYYKKREWLKMIYPHLDFVEIIDNNLVLRDKNLKNPYVEIKYKDNHLWCSYCNENHCGHVYYSIARPEVAILEMNNKHKK